MNSFEVLSIALCYIEENLSSVTPELCAEKCCYSLSNLQKMFRRVLHIGVSDYISRRKLTCAAGELIETDGSITDIALKYGYNSPEVFTRAFVRLWNITPSEFRRERRFSKIFPKLTIPIDAVDGEGVVFMYSQKFDVSELYDFIQSRNGKYVICFDMCKLMEINDKYSHKAGDVAIAECLHRIEAETDGDMLPMRIGGDEFVLITNCDNEEGAKQIAEKISSYNGETVKCGEHEFPVSMRWGLTVIPKGNLSYQKLFADFAKSCRPYTD